MFRRVSKTGAERAQVPAVVARCLTGFGFVSGLGAGTLEALCESFDIGSFPVEVDRGGGQPRSVGQWGKGR